LFHPPPRFRHPWPWNLLAGGEDRCVYFATARVGGCCICPRSERPLQNPDSARDGSRPRMVLGAKGECLPVPQGLILVFLMHIPPMRSIVHVFVAPRVAHVGERGRIKLSDVSRGGYACCGIHMLIQGRGSPSVSPLCVHMFFRAGSRHLPSKQCGGRVPPQKGVWG